MMIVTSLPAGFDHVELNEPIFGGRAGSQEFQALVHSLSANIADLEIA